LREQDGVTEKREKRGAGEKGKRLDRETVRERKAKNTLGGSEKTWKRSPTFYYGVIRSFFVPPFRPSRITEHV